jgi:CubicO group peptidase (beta-lactamase class C family)
MEPTRSRIAVSSRWMSLLCFAALLTASASFCQTRNSASKKSSAEPRATVALAQSKLPPTPGLDSEKLQLIRPRLQELVDKGVIPGAVYLVARHGRIAVYDAVGVADIENNKPMRKDTLFQIMSMTKNFTGVAAMMLVEQGKLELRRPVSDYLPEFKDIQVTERGPNGSLVTHAPKTPPTVWELMDHTSGLESDPEGAIADNEQTLRLPLADAVSAYAHQNLKYEPGSKWMYSNVGIATLGRIVEVVSGEDYIQFISSHILEPLGMADTYFSVPENERDRRAYVYTHVDGKLALAGPDTLAGDSTKFRPNMKYPAPEFGLYSTAGDLVRFYQMLLNGGVYNGTRYLSRQSIETMTRVFTPGDAKPSGWLGGTGYGLTFEIVDQPEGTLLLHSPGTYGHGGAFGTEGWIDPKNDLIRILLVQLSDDTGEAARSVVMQIGEAAVLP